MVRAVKSCLQFCLKLLNSTIGIIGIAMLLYTIWMTRVWQRDASPEDYSSSFPWFIHASLGIGITLCAVTCLGHVAADTANVCCLSCYMIVMFLLLLLETAIIADILLNSDWEKDLPEDRSGRFDDFKDFVKSNIDTCKWISALIILVQGFSILLATVLRTLVTDHEANYDTEEDHIPPRIPLLGHPAQPLPYAIGGVHIDPYFTTINEAWKMNI
ncbi:unnamed protein product [Ilex paraguariensis]|uniref:Tetraspanin-19-like n=1 Tax=Ilex paraguariensis TaxID=185542 RepID=A0ABC8ULP5_9AQUA